ncbi:MAG TPA: VWA domain-containing protein [Acidimicrobiales bacterium]|nr:VWA domain-containing protein [Acidimicrobiales bacterium]
MNGLTFLAGERLWLLVLVAAAAAAYVVLQLRRRHHAVRFTNLALLDSVAPRRPGWRRHLVAVVALLGLAAMVVGLARPARDEDVPRDEAVVMLAIDVSRSMTAEDVSPNRLVSAQDAAREFIDSVPDGFRVGLVAFDEVARTLATPTLEHDTVIAAVDRLETGRGTAAGEGIYASLEAIATVLGDGADEGDVEGEDDFAATIVLLSDGATTEGRDVGDAAADAADAGVPVTTIAYGTDDGIVDVEGELIPVPADPVTMQAVAEATGGSFFEAASASELSSVLEDIQTRVGFTTEQREVVLWFVTAAFVLVLLALAASMLWNGRFL